MRNFAENLKNLDMTAKNMTVGIFIPCCVDQFSAQSGLKMLNLMRGLGLECHYPQNLTCCGRELFIHGDRETAKTLGTRLIEDYAECSHIVSCGSSCVAYMRTQFPKLFHNTTLHNNYRHFIDNLYDISDFLVNTMRYQPSNASFPHRVALMDHCTTSHDYLPGGLHDEPRALLKAVGGLQLVEMEQNEVCCGYSATLTTQFTPISDSLAKRKVDNALAAGAEYITSTEPTCLLHLQSYIQKNNIPLNCINLIDIITATP